MVPLLFPQLAVSTPTAPPKPVPYIQLIKPVEVPRFPDRTKQALEAQAYHAEQARLVAEAKLAEELAAQQVQVAYTAPTQAVAPVSGNCASWMAQAGIADTANAIVLINKESGCNPNAINPSSGACGIPQALPCSKLGTSDPVQQLVWMQNYVFSRYGSWANALGFWYANNWY